MLYLFAGRQRKFSVAYYLRKMAKEFKCKIEVVELDILRDRKCDFTRPKVQRKWLQRIQRGEFHALVSSPPCSTFSRAVWANDGGPFPLRSRAHLRGFPWNAPKRKTKARWGNILADFSFEAIRRQLLHPGTFVLKEQPEDLGRTRTTRVPGQSPGSMWQFPQHELLLRSFEDLLSVVFPQSEFGTDSPKPTRLLLRTAGPIHPSMWKGLPEFDHDGFYVGPLPKQEGKQQLIGQVNGVFKTAAAAAWPPALCAWVARSILCTFSGPKAEGRPEDGEDAGQPEGAELEQPEEIDDKEEEGVDPTFPPHRGGYGPARTCFWKGEEVPFHDGRCLLSPGRWQRGKRKFPGGDWQKFREKLRKTVLDCVGGEEKLERECYSMARGEQGCKMVQDQQLLHNIREEMRLFLGMEESQISRAKGQPFFLGLMKGLLEKAGDGDFEFLDEAEGGVALGVLGELPRNPKAFEAQRRWPLEEDPEGRYLLEKSNYPSAGEHEEHLRKHLEAEVQEGLVEKYTVQQFENKFGENRAVAALAVLVEDAVTGKKRVIHDATHGVGVNNRIRIRDKIRMPGPREKRLILEELREKGEVAFSLIGDFGKAHRRFKYHPSEHGFLGCRVKDGEDVIYVNLVGTFGVASTPYWWARIAGCLVRVTHYLIGPGRDWSYSYTQMIWKPWELGKEDGKQVSFPLST